MKIFYWSPHISEVATIYAVINSAKSLKKYSQNKEPVIINAVGEWDEYREELVRSNIEIINLLPFKFYKYLPRYSFIKSRFTYLLIFLISFFPLVLLIKKKKPKYLISHLISSLPIFIFKIFNFKTKLILRISGLPNLNILRKNFWKISSNKIHKIFSPTLMTRKKLINEKIFNENKIFYLPDPVIEIKKFVDKKKENIQINENTRLIVAIGRLTKQKNFSFLINCFSEIIKKYKDENYQLIIIGEGEERLKIEKEINFLKLNNQIKLVGYQKNVYKFLKNAKCFILSSLWEDPGFVLIESALIGTPIISSDCENGPRELIKKNINGFTFKSNDKKDFLKTFDEYKNIDIKNIKEITFQAKLSAKNFTIFSHFKILENLLD